MDVERISYNLRGKVGDDGKLGDLDLGTEVVLIVRAVVAKRGYHYDDAAVVCDVQLSVAGAAVIGEKATWRKRALDALDQSAQADGKLL